MKKIFICIFLFAVLVLSSACTNSEQNRLYPNNSESANDETVLSAKNEESDIAGAAENNTAEAPLLGVSYAPFSFASVEEYYSSSQRSAVPDCYILKNKPESAVLTDITYMEDSFVSIHYSVPLGEKYGNEDLDEYSLERLTTIICERFLLGDGETSFKLNVLDKADERNCQKLELNGKEYYYIPEINSFNREPILLGYDVEFLENGDYIYIHIPPFDSLENMAEYLEVVKAAS